MINRCEGNNTLRERIKLEPLQNKDEVKYIRKIARKVADNACVKR